MIVLLVYVAIGMITVSYDFKKLMTRAEREGFGSPAGRTLVITTGVLLWPVFYIGALLEILRMGDE